VFVVAAFRRANRFRLPTNERRFWLHSSGCFVMTTSRHAWTYTLPSALLLMAPFDILASLAMDIFLPVVPAMPGILNTTPSMIQLALSLYMVTLGVGQVVFGPISDRIGRRPVLLAGGALFAVGSLGAAWSSTAEAFLCFRLDRKSTRLNSSHVKISYAVF